MAFEDMQRCLILLIIKEVQIKTNPGYNFQSIRLAKVQRLNKTLLKRLFIKITSIHCWAEYQMIQLLWCGEGFHII